MIGRLADLKQVGAEMRGEWANGPSSAGMSQDIQTGVRYEYNDFTNRNFLGRQGQILETATRTGPRSSTPHTDANAFSAFLQPPST